MLDLVELEMIHFDFIMGLIGCIHVMLKLTVELEL